MDIDIDFKTNFDPKEVFPQIVNASMVENGELKKHPVGVYFQNVPVDGITGLSAIPYKEAEDIGYLKIDMLHLNMLDIFDSKDEIKHLLKKEPKWKLLDDESIVSKLFHIGKHFDVIKKTNPTSVQELADVLALIRPNKIKLIDKYVKDRESTRKILYKKESASDLRKSHAIPYALLIVLQLHLIEAGIEV